MDSSALQMYIALLASLVAGGWAAYRWFVTRRKDLAQLTVAQLREQLQCEVPFVSVRFEVESDAAGAASGGRLKAIVRAYVKNEGRRTARSPVGQDLLVVRRVQGVARDGVHDLGEPVVGRYLDIGSDEPTPWQWVTIPPDATKVIPFLVDVEEPGFYYLQLRMPLTDSDARQVAETIGADRVDESKPFYWSGSEIVKLPSRVPETAG